MSDNGERSMGRGAVAFVAGVLLSRVAVGITVQLPVLLVMAVWEGSSLDSTLSWLIMVAGVIGVLACGALGVALGVNPRPTTALGVGMGASAAVAAFTLLMKLGTPDEVFVWLPLLSQAAGSIALAAGFFIPRRQKALAQTTFERDASRRMAGS